MNLRYFSYPQKEDYRLRGSPLSLSYNKSSNFFTGTLPLK